MTSIETGIKIRNLITALVMLSVMLTASPLFAQAFNQTAKPYIIEGRVSVQFTADVNVANLKSAFGLVRTTEPTVDAILDKYQVNRGEAIFKVFKQPLDKTNATDMSRFYEFQFPEDIDVLELVAELEANPHIAMAEPVWAIPLDAVPNDTYWGDQWWASPNPPDPNFYTAWDYETGSKKIIYAAIDSGVLYNHSDLKANIWVNPGEDLDGDGVVFDPDDVNGIDDDGNGYVDDFVGYDFFTGLTGGVWPGEDPGTPDNDPSDFNGHGTHIAGIAAAVTNNNNGVTGIAGGWHGGHPAMQGVRIMCCRIGATGTDGLGYINSNNAATAIAYAVANGANVINASWGGSTVAAAAASNAIANGVTFCHAAGNDNSSESDALDGVTGVLSVAACDKNDNKSSFSNFGNWVDVTAPGSDILATYSNQYTPVYNSIGGTSMASPMVCGLSLLVRSMMPSLTRDQVDSIMLANANYDDFYFINWQYQGLLGSGRIDALATLQALANAKFEADVTQGQAPLTVQFTDLSPNSPVAWDWDFGTGATSTSQNPQYTYNDVGVYDVSLVIDENNPLGPGEEHLEKYIWVTDDTLRIGDVDENKDSDVMVPIYLYNTAPVKEIQVTLSYANSIGISYDSISTAGLRTDYFEYVQLTDYDGFYKRLSILMKSNTTGGSTYLPPDSGTILKVYFSSTASEGSFELDTTSFNDVTTTISTLYGSYIPDTYESGTISIAGDPVAEFIPSPDYEINENDIFQFDVVAGSIYPLTLTTGALPGGASFTDNGDGTGTFSWQPTFLQAGVYDIDFYATDQAAEDTMTVQITVFDAPCCVGIRGNVDGDQGDIVDVGDLVYFIDYSFRSGDDPICADEADVNADLILDVADVVYLIDYQFRGGDAPLSCY